MSSTITPDDIRWLPPTAAPVDDKRCPVCDHASGHAPVLDVPAMAPPYPLLMLLKCANCASMFYDPEGIRDFSDLGQDRDDFWRIYVEGFAGVWESIWPIIADQAPGERTLLDVGCGFGFTLDFWKRSNGGEAVGVEIADYGAIGAALLDVTIYPQFLQDCAPVASRKFDIVYACEVIEHVPDPASFVTLLTRWVAEDGILIMTTPSASFVAPGNQSTSLLAALAPGFHGFVLSPRALGDLARKAGFAHVDVREFGERQMLWASNRAHILDTDAAKLRPAYFKYVAERFALDGDTGTLWQGLAYRYLRDLANTGRLSEAKVVAARLVSELESRYGPVVADSPAAVKRLTACTSLTDVGRIGPLFLPNLYYFLGSLAQQVNNDRASALQLFTAAGEATTACVRLGAIFFLESISLLWPARVAAAYLHLTGPDTAAGAALLAKLGDEGRVLSAANSYATVAPGYIESTLPRACEALISSGQRVEADTIFAAYQRYLKREYGPSLLTEDGIGRALRRGDVPIPIDPLFPLWFDGLRNPRIPDGTGASYVANPALLAVIRLGDAFEADPRAGARARDLARRARQLAAQRTASPPGILFDYSYTMRPPKS
jgi:SAM-dependent methyltransferase